MNTPHAKRIMAAAFKGPRAAGMDPTVMVWIARHPDCGCVWGWSLDRTTLRYPLDTLRLVTAEVAEQAMGHTAVHHMTGQRFHVAHADRSHA